MNIIENLDIVSDNAWIDIIDNDINSLEDNS
jgi:hypothetical protein